MTAEILSMKSHGGLRIAPGLTLPLDAVTETFAILGRRGSGKTHTAVVMAEEMLTAGVQVVVIDPLDVWWGLRVSKDGKKAGFPIYVAGGSHADVPLPADSGRVLADAIVDRGLSMVMSLRHLSKTDQRRFVGDFCERLYDRKADPAHRTPLHVFIDEADAFVPQRLMPGSERCFGAVDTLVRRGRSSGLAPTLISQRPQVINKDVLSQTEVLVSHQLTGPQDRKALQAWIEANDTENRGAEFMGSLASLPRGHAWFWSPGLLGVFTRVHIRDRDTFDSSATPKPGAVAAAAKVFAPVDLAKLTAEIAATIERAKADDPRELRKQIAELKKEITAKAAQDYSKIITSVGKTKEIERFVLKDGQLARLEKSGQTLGTLSNKLFDLTGQVQALWKDISAAVERTRQPLPPVTVSAHLSPTAKPETRRALATMARTVANRPSGVALVSSTSDVSLPLGERTILTAVAQCVDGADRAQLTVLTGYKRSTRDRYLQFLQQKAFVVVRGDRIEATDAGLLALGDFEPLPTGDALREHWLARLPEGERAILAVVAKGFPREVDRNAVSDATGYKRSTRDRYIQFLQTRKLVTSNRDGVRASEDLFS